ncbi:hypothetical protein RRG08_049279 [Elysia crispata]|uniref:Uncharacterized protein n=1 Tax=Elysia crispata TaxID=231223 RepID=A0AAE0ZNP6_9GAST|nr:hypothetical protein RRG08_049279 [Elysia crispata]
MTCRRSDVQCYCYPASLANGRPPSVNRSSFTPGYARFPDIVRLSSRIALSGRCGYRVKSNAVTPQEGMRTPRGGALITRLVSVYRNVELRQAKKSQLINTVFD